MDRYKRTFNPCDECGYSYSKNGQETGKCKICEFKNYVDLDRKRRLVELPCKVGDTVWLIYERQEIHEMRVQGISVSVSGKDTILHFGGYPITTAWGSSIGEVYFLTREEAEAKLAEIEQKVDHVVNVLMGREKSGLRF